MFFNTQSNYHSNYEDILIHKDLGNFSQILYERITNETKQNKNNTNEG